MRTIAALLLALPLVASAQGAPPPATWIQEPAPAAAPATAPAEPAPAQPAIAAPLPAAAQPAYPPPPQAAPAAQPQPPPPSPAPDARRPRTRDRWYLGFGVGGGNGRVSTESSSYTFRDVNGGRGTDTTFFNLKVGGTVSPTLLVGADLSGTLASADAGGVQTELGISNLDAVVTWFPYERGLFVRGGAGLSSISYRYQDDAGKEQGSREGANVLGGVGYAFWLGSQFNLTLNLDLSRQWYGGSSNLRITSGAYWALWVGFDWY